MQSAGSGVSAGSAGVEVNASREGKLCFGNPCTEGASSPVHVLNFAAFLSLAQVISLLTGLNNKAKGKSLKSLQ